MNVTVIYGSMRKTSTCDCVKLLLNNLKLNTSIKVNEFYLSKLFQKNNPYLSPKNNLHSSLAENVVNAIIKSIDASDLVIFASPVFTCDISSEMKSLLHKLSYHYAATGRNSLMHNKIGLAVSTTAGAGLSLTTRTLEKNLNYLGIKSTFRFSYSLFDINWEDVSFKIKKQLNKKISKLSHKVLHLYQNSKTSKPRLFIIKTPKKKVMAKNDNYNIINLHYFKKRVYSSSRNV